jgi:hypothetical protein
MRENKLVTLIDEFNNYTINDLVDLCARAGFEITRYKIYNAIKTGRLKSVRIGGKYTDHYIEGTEAIRFFLKE